MDYILIHIPRFDKLAKPAGSKKLDVIKNDQDAVTASLGSYNVGTLLMMTPTIKTTMNLMLIIDIFVDR